MSAFKIFMLLSHDFDGCVSWYGSCLANMYGNQYHHVSLNSGVCSEKLIPYSLLNMLCQ